MFSGYRCQNYTTLLPQLFSVALILFTFKLQPVKASSNFTIDGDEYNCNGNMICLGDAHIFTGANFSNFFGRLSLTHHDDFENDGHSAGIAYYKEPIRLLDPGTNRSASFNTSFQFHEVPEYDNHTQSLHYAGDGLTFVLSADNSTLGDGASGQNFGFFDSAGVTSFKSVVIEFDNFQNNWPIMYDINDNHVSIDIHNITAAAARDASEVGIQLYNETPVFAWVEYAAPLRTLEVRISYQKSRPLSPFLSLQGFDLSDVIEEYMWVGFTGGNGVYASTYYIGNWSFESSGIPGPAEVHRETRGRGKWGIVFGTTGAVFAFVVAVVLILTLCFLRRRGLQARGAHRKFPLLWTSENSYGEPYGDDLQLSQEGYPFSHEELSRATRGFREEAKLGEGGFGCVYRGELPKSKFPVAVKKIARDSQQGEREFRAEVSIISQLRHRNLIRLLGWCVHKGKYYIVYDLMPNGSLDKALFTYDHDRSTVLSWPQRFKIVQGTATAVEYLHHGWNQQVIHRDIKASNIMLDDHWNAKLGDFGLARLTDHHKTPNTTLVAGTPGYIAPEAVSSRKFTEKTDVFAFGALALEIACGRRSLTLHVLTEEIVLVDWVWQRYSEGDLLSVVDRRLDEFDVEQMKTLLLLGLICSHPNPLARPPMRVVVQVLYGDAPVPSVPISKPSFRGKTWSMDTDSNLQHPNDSNGESISVLLDN